MRIGVDLGGTKVEGILVNDQLKILERIRKPTPNVEGYPAILRTVVELIGELDSKAGHPCHIGIGTPGALSQVTGRMKNSNTLVLNDQPLKEDLESALDRKIRMANDANCFVLSEAIDGAAKGKNVVFGIILGTGVGGGIVINQQVIDGLHGIAGEWGHNELDPKGPMWFDGRPGCVESFLCGGALAREYVGNGAQEGSSSHDLVQAMRSGDKIAIQTFDEWIDRFGKALSVVLNILDPDVVVLGGGLSNNDEIYEKAPTAAAKYIFNDEMRAPIVKNVHGDSSGVRGAALLWPNP